MGQPLKTPDITPAQIPALVAAAGQTIAALGIVTPSAAQEASISRVLATTVGIAAVDAVVRFGRSVWKGLEARAAVYVGADGHPTTAAAVAAAPSQDLSDSATPPAAAQVLGVRV